MGRILAALIVALGGGAAAAAPSWKKHGMGRQGPKTLQAETFAVAGQTWFAVHGIFGGKTNLIRSRDGGLTWEAAPGLPANEWAQSVVSKDGVVYVATSGGIYRSSDYGEHWTRIKQGMTKKRVTSLAAGTQSVVAIIDRNTLLCSTLDKKGGYKWKRARIGLPRKYDALGDVVVVGGSVFVGVTVDQDKGDAKVFRSSDGCRFFQPVMVGATVKGTDRLVIAGGVQGFVVSTDQGAHFKAVPSPTKQEGTYNFVVVGDAVYAGLIDVAGPTAIVRLSSDREGWDRLSVPGVPQTKTPPVFMLEGQYLYLIANTTELYSIDVRALSAN
jgi:photosystem II stability/assembly factor-like uncharacterized protein